MKNLMPIASIGNLYASANRYLLLFYLTVGSVFFSSCDPVRVLIIENNGNKEAEIVFHFHEIDESDYRLLTAYKDSVVVVKSINNNDELIVFKEGDENSIAMQFPENMQERKATLFFGWGSWSDSLLYEFSGLIESIVITQNGHQTAYKKREDIYNLLKNNKKRGVIEFKL